MTQPTGLSKLDLLHKGVYPAIATVLTLSGLRFAVYVYRSNNDKQAQLDRLQGEMQAVKAQLEAAERKQHDLARQAEEFAHRMRFEVCRVLHMP
jgi:hypothetical protein